MAQPAARTFPGIAQWLMPRADETFDRANGSGLPSPLHRRHISTCQPINGVLVTDSPPMKELGPRERELLGIVYSLGNATVAEVRSAMKQPTSYSSVRTMLNLLETKGLLRRDSKGMRHVYAPTTTKEQARWPELRNLVDTFFDGSLESVVRTFLSSTRQRPSAAELKRLSRIIADVARDEER